MLIPHVLVQKIEEIDNGKHSGMLGKLLATHATLIQSPWLCRICGMSNLESFLQSSFKGGGEKKPQVVHRPAKKSQLPMNQ